MKKLLLGRTLEENKAISKTNLNWDAIHEKVKLGVRNMFITSIAPNSSTSVLLNSSASYIPVFNKFYFESMNKMNIPVAPKFIKNRFWFYNEGFTVPTEKIVKLTSKIQKWVDCGISMELIINPSLTNIKKISDSIIEESITPCSYFCKYQFLDEQLMKYIGSNQTVNLYFDTKNVLSSLHNPSEQASLIHQYNSSADKYVVARTIIVLANHWMRYFKKRNIGCNIFFFDERGNSVYHNSHNREYKSNRQTSKQRIASDLFLEDDFYEKFYLVYDLKLEVVSMIFNLKLEVVSMIFISLKVWMMI